MKITDTLKQIIEKVEPYYAEGQKEIDITAVMKYFRKLGIFIGFLDETNEIMLYNNKYHYLDGKNSVGRFGNKPLHLYTEEELQNLLEILNNIENND